MNATVISKIVAILGFRPPRRPRKLVLAVVLCNTVMPIVIVGLASACEGGGEELPANFVFSKKPVKFAGNEKLPVKVTNTGFTGLEPNPPTAEIEMETSAAEKFTDKLEK
jgi:hypothetical protein